MNFDKVEFHNTAGVEKLPGHGDNALVRIPAEVRNKLNQRARFIGMESVGCEVRFVTDAPNVDLYISCTKPEFFDQGEIRVFKGNHRNQVVNIEPGTVHNIRLTKPDAFNNVPKVKLDREGFSSDVWRITFNRGGVFSLHGIDTFGYDIRPPRAEEKPALKWLAYGSSITNSNLDGYPHFASRLLKIDVQNKGLSGACQCEKEIVDWIVDACKWDVLTCEMGINMRGGFSPEEFRKRVDYLLNKATATGKPVIAINLYPNSFSEDWSVDPEHANTVCEAAYNQAVRDVVADINAPNLFMIEGRDILTDFTGLTSDLLHPCAFGHAIMGANLAAKMKDILGL